MLSMVLKDVRLLLRSPGELALLLLMPLVLTGILGFALGGLLGGGAGGESVALELHATLVLEDDEAAGTQEFMAALAQSDAPPAERAGLLLAAQQLRPQDLLRDVLDSEGLREMLTVAEADRDGAMAALAAGETQLVIVMPAGYTGALLRRMLLDEGPGAELALALGEDAPMLATVIRDVLRGFTRQLNFSTAIGQSGYADGRVEIIAPEGGVESLQTAERISLVTYYTFGMAVMFALYVAGAVSSRASTEQENHTYSRIQLSGTGPYTYLAGKFVAAVIIAFAQLLLLLVISNLLLRSLTGRGTEFWLSAAALTLGLAVAVAGITVLLTALNFRAGNRALSDLFYAMVPMILAMLGGSFFPLEGVLADIGAWTPNGAATSGLVKAARGMAAASWWPELARMVIMGGLLAVFAARLFPRNWEAAK